MHCPWKRCCRQFCPEYIPYACASKQSASCPTRLCYKSHDNRFCWATAYHVVQYHQINLWRKCKLTFVCGTPCLGSCPRKCNLFNSDHCSYFFSHRTPAPTSSFLGSPPPPVAKAGCYTGSTLSSHPPDIVVSFSSCYQTGQKGIQNNRDWGTSLAVCDNSLLRRGRDERRPV